MGLTPCQSDPSVPQGGRRIIALLMVLVFVSACTPAGQKDEELRKEIQALKTQVTALQEKLNQLEGRQQAILDLLKQPPPPPTVPQQPMAMPSPPPVQEPLTVGELLANKDRYLGSKVTVKGEVGTVMMHHKSLMLKSPKGMVEVLFGNLPDPKAIQTLNSTQVNKPITVTGMVSLAPSRGSGGQVQINAEAVEF